MKNLKNLFLVIMLVSCFAFSASAQTAGSITLVHVDGLLAPDTIAVGQPIVFHFRLVNNSGQSIFTFNNGFTVYTPDAAVWETTFGSFTDAIDINMIDGLGQNQTSTDGSGADSIAFFGQGVFCYIFHLPQM